MDSNNQSPQVLDQAIIGGGVSGVYSAWRLQQQSGGEQSIALFEYSNRIGGRLYSRKIPGLDNVVAELGGMRWIAEDHPMVNSLVHELKLAIKEFPMGSSLPLDPKVKDSPKAGTENNLFYLRGQYFRYRDFAECPDRIPYNLGWSERGYGPEDMQVKVMNLICPGFADMSLAEQMAVEVNGKPMWQYGFWNLLESVLSNEAYQFMKDAGGYEANVANANAVTQLPATEYKDDTQFLGLKQGFQALPLTLCDCFEKLGGAVHMDMRLAEIRIDPGSDARYTLIFQPTSTDDSGKTTDTDAACVEVQAKKVILAMPRRSLELIKSDYFEDEWLQSNIPSVLIQKAFKMFMAYESPWWRSLGLVYGRSVTDLPIRQTYYMGTECDASDVSVSTNSLLMASYNDIGTVPYWKGLEAGEPFEGYTPAGVTLSAGESIVPNHEFQISDAMVQAAQRQLEAVHNQKQLPQPYSAVYQEWGHEPYGGGWHEWKAGFELDKVMQKMRHPVEGEDIYIVGEAYSYDQGWVEGALVVAESMLEEFYGLDAPSWLKVSDASHAFLPSLSRWEPQLLTEPYPVPENDSATKANAAIRATLDEVTTFAYEGINHAQQ